MFKNHLKIAFRNMINQKLYSLINISGLAVGMACSILIFIFIDYELSYDKYHQHSKRIFRITQERHHQDKILNSAITPNPMAPELLDTFPEIINAVRIDAMHHKVLITSEDKHVKEDRFFLADPSVFKVFTFPLITGNSETVLADPFSIVVTEEIAEKYFGDENPIGKILNFENRFDFKITGIMKNIPANSHFRCDFIAPFACADNVFWEGYSNDRTQSSVHTYILLDKNALVDDLETKFPAFIEKFVGSIIKEYGQGIEQMPGGIENIKFKLHLQPLTGIHLRSHLFAELDSNYDIRYIYFYSAIAIIVLLIACINFVNLSTAHSANRAKEVGLRKVIGANRAQLIKQFLGESIFITMISLAVALAMIKLLLMPVFNSIIGDRLDPTNYYDWKIIPGIVFIALVVGTLSGSYSALFISAFQPIHALKGSFKIGSRNPLKNILVVFQLAVSITLIIATMIMTDQLSYIKNKQLGFQKEHVIVVPLEDDRLSNSYDSLKNEILKNPNVINVTGASNVLSRVYSDKPVWWEGAQDDESIRIQKIYVDYDFIKTFGIEIKAGRDFSREISSDERNAFMINESAAKVFSWKNPIGKRIDWAYQKDKRGEVIGVITDFHFRPLHQKIEPLILRVQANNLQYLYARLQSKDISQTLKSLNNQWSEFFPEVPFEYFFLDADIDNMYKSEQSMSHIFGYTALLAIFIACFGLFGLISYTTEQRTKEIGIRKVLGATVSGIVLLLTKEFTKWVIVANIIAIPLAYYIMNKWLQGFAYRITINFRTFIFAAVLTLAIAMFTISYQAIKAALANPVDSLRYE